ncbi:MAG: hypothetical protein RLZZ148_323 [Cyanobacteriota bacterium]|jgi:hypothetical protein
MFLEELQPLLRELIGQPVAFAGGFVSGILRLKVSEDPLKQWLREQGIISYSSNSATSDNGNSPQSIAID